MPFLGDSGRFRGRIGIITPMSDIEARVALLEDTVIPEMWLRFSELEKSISLIGEGVVIMAERTIIRQSELEGIKYQIASFAEGLGEIEKRVDRLEKHNSTVNWVMRQLGTILLVVGLVYLFSIWL